MVKKLSRTNTKGGRRTTRKNVRRRRSKKGGGFITTLRNKFKNRSRFFQLKSRFLSRFRVTKASFKDKVNKYRSKSFFDRFAKTKKATKESNPMVETGNTAAAAPTDSIVEPRAPSQPELDGAAPDGVAPEAATEPATEPAPEAVAPEAAAPEAVAPAATAPEAAAPEATAPEAAAPEATAPEANPNSDTGVPSKGGKKYRKQKTAKRRGKRKRRTRKI